MKQVRLSEGWQLKQRNASLSLIDDFTSLDGWLSASVPGVVHLDLLQQGQIPDPFAGTNEEQLQWIGDCDWLYRCEFEIPDELRQAQVVELCFDGLDTFATVWFNGTRIIGCENMFLSHRVPVTKLLRPGRNTLHILFEAAMPHGKEREAQEGVRSLWNGDSSRVYVRKAQYHYGWDWGPVFMTSGPWRPVRLEAYDARIAELHCPANVAADLRSATVPVSVQIQSAAALTDAELHLVVEAPDGSQVTTATLPVTEEAELQHTFTLENPQLWWPHGYGEQPLYRVVATLCKGDVVYDERSQRLGLRRLELIQRPLAEKPGTSFFFQINNVPIFCGGANWIPADSFLPRVTPERYRRWLQLAVDANMNMLRVWGGGIYEEDVFYDLCDEMGLLVWQDLMFACALYPASEWFQESVRKEVDENLRRLRHHPSIVIWAGNNEDYQLAASEGKYDPAFQGDFTQTEFPARVLYERMFPELCAKLDPTRPYWPGSPYAGANPDDPTQGDKHAWGIWQTLEPYQNYPQYAGRFVSEFGMQAFPDVRTLASVAEKEELYPQSRTLDFHNKGLYGPERIAGYIQQNLRIPGNTLEDYIYASQFVQSEAIGGAIRSWRRLWRGEGREETAGALVWQLNDCWPVTSWALVDYALRPKPSYYTIRRELAPFALGIAHAGQKRVAIWGVSSLRTEQHAELEVRVWKLDGTLVTEEKRPVTLLPNQATELMESEQELNGSCVIAVRLLVQGEVLARASLWPEPFKYLTLPDPGVTVERLDEQTVRVQAQRPAKGVYLTANDGVKWSDNMLDVFPGDPQVLVAEGLDETEITVRKL
uniref:Beta-mannosidase B n=1 Tax=Thermosporothrix sp. COM3 TaxID=2490863 RepID=A0A455SPS9_9CHLR|nr:beta-mannosidase [Thermosporothrix sp. COM3]